MKGLDHLGYQQAYHQHKEVNKYDITTIIRSQDIYIHYKQTWIMLLGGQMWLYVTLCSFLQMIIYRMVIMHVQ